MRLYAAISKEQLGMYIWKNIIPVQSVRWFMDPVSIVGSIAGFVEIEAEASRKVKTLRFNNGVEWDVYSYIEYYPVQECMEFKRLHIVPGLLKSVNKNNFHSWLTDELNILGEYVSPLWLDQLRQSAIAHRILCMQEYGMYLKSERREK